MTWREKVKDFTQVQNMTQKDLTQRSSVTKASVSRDPGSNRQARLNVVVVFAKALGVTAKYLLEEDFGLEEDAFTEMATAIAANGKNLSPEEKNKLIALLWKSSCQKAGTL